MKTKYFQCPKCGYVDEGSKPLSKTEIQDIYIGLKEGIEVAEMASLIGRTKQFVYAIKNRKFKPEWTEGL